MEFEVMSSKLMIAIEQVRQRDSYLLRRDLNEPAISHRFAIYLAEQFVEFDVDCEYNGNADYPGGKKIITMLQAKAWELGLLKENNVDAEFVDRHVYPDIIVHKRGSNEQGSNLLVVEVKKTSSTVSGDWDAEKLRRFTFAGYGNTFNYQYGVFVRFPVKERLDLQIEWYQDGKRI